MTTADLHVIGSAHEARFGESFDAELAAAIESAYDPARAVGELDELGLPDAIASPWRVLDGDSVYAVDFMLSLDTTRLLELSGHVSETSLRRIRLAMRLIT
ncbi:MAG: hypothetical protein R2761_29720 [Acidimicrobiales bacterium]